MLLSVNIVTFLLYYNQGLYLLLMCNFLVQHPLKKVRYTEGGYISLSRRHYIGNSSSILYKPFSIQYRLEFSARRGFLSTKESVLNKALYKYDNPIEQRDQIRKDNDGKSGECI
jgi:hypothetical protein